MKRPLVAVALLITGAAAAQPTYTNVTDICGVDYTQGFQLGGTDSMTGGAAARDYDGDGWCDLVVTRFNDPPILFRNNGDGTFADVTVAAGLSGMVSESNGAAWGDIDNDGDPDLYITSVKREQPNHLYINQGDGTFVEEGVLRGADLVFGRLTRYGTSASFGDYDRDGWLDIHVNEWGAANVNPPEIRSHARLLRNNGSLGPGTFTDQTAPAGVSLDDQYGIAPLVDPGDGVWSFGTRFADLDRDGHPDLIVVSDFVTSRLYWNNGDGTFLEGTAAAGVGTDENGMGLAVGDHDSDGDLDFFVTSIFHVDPPLQGHNVGGNYGTSGNRLFRNNGDRTFTDVTDAAGVRDGAWGWGASFLDYDNDGDLDLTMTNGFFGPSSDFFTDRSKLWSNNGDGTFADVGIAEGIWDNDLGKGLLTFDFDNDGDLDIFIVNNGGSPNLYRNDTVNGNNWLKIRLEGRRSNRDGIGAMITLVPRNGLPVLIREVQGGTNYLSQNDVVAHFGLGQHPQLIESITVEWPSGLVSTIRNVATNRLLRIVERPLIREGSK